MSVAMPALPSSFKNFSHTSTRITIIAAILLVASIGGFFLIPDFEMRSMLLMALTVGFCMLTLVSTRQMKKLVVERDDYEKRLQEMAYKLTEKNSNLKQLVQIDPLTQLLNRRGLEKALSIEMNRAQRKGLRMFAVLLDCDDFKAVNETYGHAVGDLVLQAMAENIYRSVRPTDYASRIGGDEFIVFLIDVDEVDSAHVAERIRQNISDCPAMQNGKPVPCTASLGVAELPATLQTIEEVLEITRAALKSSKTSGKNAVTINTLQKA
jgi:diguanylate cyclase (GGDEF)-like protein